MPLDLTDDKSTLVQVMAWCLTAPSHYLSQCWLRFMLLYLCCYMVSLGNKELTHLLLDQMAAVSQTITKNYLKINWIYFPNWIQSSISSFSICVSNGHQCLMIIIGIVSAFSNDCQCFQSHSPGGQFTIICISEWFWSIPPENGIFVHMNAWLEHVLHIRSCQWSLFYHKFTHIYDISSDVFNLNALITLNNTIALKSDYFSLTKN